MNLVEILAVVQVILLVFVINRLGQNGDKLMKESEVKALIKTAAGRTEEAFGEIGTRIGAMQKQIDDLIAGAGDPEVTDQEFLSDLQKLKTNTDSLADIVPNPNLEPPV